MDIVCNWVLMNPRTGAVLVVYGQALDTTFRMPLYPMLNQRNANPMTANHGL